jgi:hypothetical protein
MGIVTGLVLMFSFTFSGLVWLVRDVDRGISLRAPAQAIAFQAARAGAQQIDAESLRVGASHTLIVNPVAAELAVQQAVEQSVRSEALLSSTIRIELVSVAVGSDSVEVKVEISDGLRKVVGHGMARSLVGP